MHRMMYLQNLPVYPCRSVMHRIVSAIGAMTSRFSNAGAAAILLRECDMVYKILSTSTMLLHDRS